MKRLFILFFFSLFLVTQPAFSLIAPGEITSHPADAEIAYNWFSYVPTGIDKSVPIFILVNADNGFYQDYDSAIEDTKMYTGHRSVLAERYNYVLLKPVIPREFDPNWGGSEIYVGAFDRRVFSEITNSFLQRPDLKVTQMIDRLKNQLRAEGYQVMDKVMLEGFSLGGMFAQRYALLHPERVQAVAAGHAGGTLILPEITLNGTAMNWPVGVNDFESLAGKPFNRETYKQIPQYIYIGDHDDNRTVVKYPGDSFYTDEEVDFLSAAFGGSPPTMLKNQSEYLQKLGYNIQFELYPNESTGPQTHGTALAGSVEDVFAFFDANKGNVVDVRRFVTRFYQQCLSREPDSPGLTGWTNALLNGSLTGSDIAWSFIFSDEFINRYTTNEDFVTILYRAFFNREPDSAGYSGWLNMLYDGTSRSAVLDGFTGSQEFRNLCGSYGITPN